MPLIDIRGQMVNVDVRSELEEFEWHSAKWHDDKLIAGSPFRDDRSPSFFVRLEPGDGYPAGIFSDSGAYDDSYAKGGFVKLLAFLRKETFSEAADYLVDKYGLRGEKRELVIPHIPKQKHYGILDPSIIDVRPSPYLTRRGIAPDVQIAAGVGKGRFNGYVALPWKLVDGRLANVKYRATQGKTFFYEEGAWPITDLVWGVDCVRGGGALIICEAEIDALSWRTAGYDAVAIGNLGVTELKADIILRLDFDRIYLGGDNDSAGMMFNEKLYRVLHKKAPLSLLRYGNTQLKDVNDILLQLGSGYLHEMVRHAQEIPRLSINLN